MAIAISRLTNNAGIVGDCRLIIRMRGAVPTSLTTSDRKKSSSGRLHLFGVNPKRLRNLHLKSFPAFPRVLQKPNG